MNLSLKKILVCLLCAICILSNFSFINAYAQDVHLLNVESLKATQTSNTKEERYAKAISRIKKAIKEYKKEVSLSDLKLNNEEASILFHEVIFQKDYFYAVEATYLYYSPETVDSLEIKYLCKKKDLDSYKKKLISAMNKYLKPVQESWTDIQKIIYIHDAIIRNTTYSTSNKKNHYAYSALVDNVACCDGYTGAFSMLLNELGIKSSFAFTSSHAWNMVKLNGKWYNVDCTFDDSCINGIQVTNTELCGHQYFLISTSKLKSIDKDHNNMFSIYKADSKLYDQFSWAVSNRPVVIYGGNIIYSDSNGNIKNFNIKTNKITTLKTINDIWIDWTTATSNRYTYSMEKFVSLAIKDSILYYNTSSSVYEYDLKTGKSRSIATIDHKKNKNRNILGLRIEGNKLYGYFAVNPYSRDEKMLITTLS